MSRSIEKLENLVNMKMIEMDAYVNKYNIVAELKKR